MHRIVLIAGLLVCLGTKPQAAPLLGFFHGPNLAGVAMAGSASLSYFQAFATDLPTLRAWFVSNTGPTIPMTKTYVGTYAVTDQADADALVGTAVTGNVVVTATASNVHVHDFSATCPSGLGTADANHTILLDLVGGPANVSADHFKLDGNRQIACQGIGGDSYATNISLSNGEVTATGDDGSKAFSGTFYTQMYIHDLRSWNTASDGTWLVGPNNTAYPHQDGIQAQRGATVIYQSWVESSDSPTATSGLLCIPAFAGVNMTMTATYSYFSGSANQPIQVFNNDFTAAGNTSAGNGALITSFVFQNNLIGTTYGKYPQSPYAMTLYSDVALITNVLTADTHVAIAAPVAPELVARPITATQADLLLNVL